MKNVAVYLGSLYGDDPKFQQLAQEVGAYIATKGYTLVYGAGSTGLMDAVAQAAIENEGDVIGVIPEFLIAKEAVKDGLSQTHIVQKMSERKQMMMDYADAFITLPGGPGTLEEVSEIISLKRLHQLDGPCIIYNYNHFYDPLQQLLETMIEHGFMEGMPEDVYFVESMEALKEIL